MSEIVPIREDVRFSCDIEREMIDYLIGRVKLHLETYGEAPVTAAIVTESAKGRLGHSWSVKPLAQHDKLATCAAAALILQERAIQRD